MLSDPVSPSIPTINPLVMLLLLPPWVCRQREIREVLKEKVLLKIHKIVCVQLCWSCYVQTLLEQFIKTVERETALNISTNHLHQSALCSNGNTHTNRGKNERGRSGGKRVVCAEMSAPPPALWLHLSINCCRWTPEKETICITNYLTAVQRYRS